MGINILSYACFRHVSLQKEVAVIHCALVSTVRLLEILRVARGFFIY